MSTESGVAAHYTRGGLEDTILQALARAGKDVGRLTAADLTAIDEFHVGGIESTRRLGTEMRLHPGMRLLDVGCGIGGPARYFASEYGCQVTGVDLTEEFVRVAGSLTRRVGLDHLASFRQGSALSLPFEADAFDAAYMIHVGMNIADKPGIFRQVRRVLKPGATFAIFDMMRTGEGAIRYPVPWAITDETSFVARVEAYRGALEASGFRVTRESNQREFAIAYTEEAFARMGQHGPPVLGLHLLMGDKTPVMGSNILGLMRDGIVEPVELFAEAV